MRWMYLVIASLMLSANVCFGDVYVVYNSDGTIHTIGEKDDNVLRDGQEQLKVEDVSLNEFIHSEIGIENQDHRQIMVASKKIKKNPNYSALKNKEEKDNVKRETRRLKKEMNELQDLVDEGEIDFQTDLLEVQTKYQQVKNKLHKLK